MKSTKEANPPAAKPLSRPKQTYDHFGVSHTTLWRWAQQSGFPQPLKRGKVVLYDLTAIESWLAGDV